MWVNGQADVFHVRAHFHSQYRSEEHTSEHQSPCNLVCRLLLEKKKKDNTHYGCLKGNLARDDRTTRQCVGAARVGAESRYLRRVPVSSVRLLFFFFFFNDTATTEIYPLSLHDALPICLRIPSWTSAAAVKVNGRLL